MPKLDVLPPNESRGELLDWLHQKADAAYARRRAEYEDITTAAGLRQYARRRRRYFLEKIGGLPRRTPLKARVTGKLSGNAFSVEKVVFESQPGLLVTGNLYLPESGGPHPAVLVPCGHNDEGKAAAPHQRLCMLLATHGLAAFCYDPIGQGERYQFITPQHTRRYWPTLEHSMLGMGAVLLGTNTARYRLHDGRRALDYLEGRPDIDGERLGCTGYSGGGTLTSYLMALDPRVACAAPCCYISSLERTVQELGPQDAEQNIYGQVAFGMEHGDYLLMRFPKPTLICAATRDFFPIDGAWAVFREVKRLYGRLGRTDRVDLVEDASEHDYSSVLRVAATRWMRRWLLGADDEITEPRYRLFAERQLRCTPRGQVVVEAGARTGFDLNADLEKGLARRRRRGRSGQSAAARRRAIREVAGVPTLAKLPSARCAPLGSKGYRGYRVERLLLGADGHPRLPALAYAPRRRTADPYLMVYGGGKQACHTEAVQRARQGCPVLCVDVRGCGESRTPAEGIYHRVVPLAYLLGLSFVGMRTTDILVAARIAGQWRGRSGQRPVHLVAAGAAGPAALHAAALEPDLFASVEVRGSLASWSQLVRAPEASLEFLEQTVHGALCLYDLPDLAELIPQDRLTIEKPLDPALVPVVA